jgi:lysophospholipase L1-like esterase
VLNRGINGDIVEGIKDRIDPIVNGHPAKIFLLTGVNDVSHNLSADSIANALGELIDIIRTRTPQTRLYVQSLLPINNSFGRYKLMFGKEQVIRDINALLEPIAKSKGCIWINSNPLFCNDEGNLKKDWTNDGLHLLAPGYLAWRDFLLPYINE